MNSQVEKRGCNPPLLVKTSTPTLEKNSTPSSGMDLTPSDTILYTRNED